MRFLIGIFLYFGFFTAPVLAVPPPDFLFNVGAQLAQIFAIVAIFLSAAFGIVYNYLKVYLSHFRKFRYRKLVVFVGIALILAVSLGFAFWYQRYQQEQLYVQWLHKSETHQGDGPAVGVGNVMTSEKMEVTPSNVSPVSQQALLLENLPLSVSNQEFQKVLESGKNVFVLDGREDEEYSLGRFPQSTHVRFAAKITGVKIGNERASVFGKI